MLNADCIISAGYVLTMDESLSVVRNGAVVIKDAMIADIGNSADILKRYQTGQHIRKPDSVLLPGLINTHTHAAMVYFRGIADDLPLNEWLNNHIWPAENRWLSPEFISDATGLACLEMLRAGVTVYNDMYFFEDEAGEVTKKMGMRAVLGSGVLDFPTRSGSGPDEYIANAVALIEKWKGDELIVPCIAPHALYTCGPETLKKVRAVAEKYGIPIHIHLSETEWEVREVIARYGKRPAEYLESLGFLDERVLAAHCIWLEDSEIELLAKRNVGVSHCMESNLKLASGFAPVATMIAKGVKVTFGTDGAASNNDLNIMSEMSTTAKVHKALSQNPTVLDAKTVLLMATRWGAEALGLGKTIGSIEKGKAADMISINISKPHLTPLYDVFSHIVYAAMASDVDMVMVNGKLLVDGGRLLTGDEGEILHKARAWGEKIKAADRQ
jgi:5-methylthioadenosine/S-adenosylhomocysteine deaminase